MPIGYSGAPRVTHNNMGSRLRRFSRSLKTGNSGTPLRITLISSEELNLEAAPDSGNTNARRPVLNVFSSEFRNAANTSVVNATVVIGYKNDCGFLELRHAADNTLLFGIDNTFVGNPNSVLYINSSGFMKAVNTSLAFDDTIGQMTIKGDDSGLTPTLIIEQDGTGDSFINLLLTSGQGYSFGIDNDDSDKLKLGIGNTLGGAGLEMDSSGNVTVTTNFKTYDNSADTTPIVTVEQDGAGDAFINFLLTSTNGYAFGIDNSDNDILKLCTGNTVGGAGTRVAVDTSGNVGFHLESMSNPFHVGKAAGLPLAEVNVNTTLTDSHFTVLVNCNSLNRVITLPAASGATDRIYNIKKIDSSANTVTIDGNLSETIDGATTFVLSAQWDSVLIQCDGTNWFKIGNI